MEKATNVTRDPDYVWEYYYDYLDPVLVDEKQLTFNKYSLVIIFWICMAAFVFLLFLVLLHLSRSGNQTSVWSHMPRKRGKASNY